MDRAEMYFRDAVSRRGDYGEATNNLALVMVRKGQTDAAVELLEGFLRKRPEYEAGYLTLSRIYSATGRTKEAVATLERLLQRHPQHPAALDLLQQFKAKIDFD
jgi:tetratricopeptide (TPR) repeat protein